MSLPPGFLDELRSRLSIAQVAGRKVAWDLRKSNQGRGDMWAPCPFHQEKTASFHVDDRKGFYYCFGCHAKGDAISFVRETENVGFPEAVEILAREAGMAMPARDPQAAEKADHRTRLAEVMEEAVRWLRLQLRTGAGAAARDYLAGRGLGAAQVDRWELGFAPDSRQGMFKALTARGVPADLIVEAGLCARPEDGGAPYDRFRGRIVFPIRDARGRAIALGGRAMAPDARSKYLNSPQTPLFDKGRSLYNHAPARDAAGRGQRLIVTEGYMDVIALAEAGFEAAVAPLGTAITAEQLALMWRIDPQPVIALDGDAAGLRAAMRLVDLALPLLEAGRTLHFAVLPQGQDPDDLIRAGGAAAMQAEVDRAIPLVRMLWQREYADGAGLETPEAKAALDARLAAAIRTIADRSVARYYADAVRQFKWEAFRARNWAPPAKAPGGGLGGGPGGGPRGGFRGGFRGGLGGGAKAMGDEAATGSARASLLARDADGRSVEALRERVILAALIANPPVMAAFEYGLETVDFRHDDHRGLMLALLEHWRSAPSVEAEIGALGLGDALRRVSADPMIRVVSGCHAGAEPHVVKMTVAEALARLAADRAMRREIEEGEEDIQGAVTEALTWRLGQAAAARDRAGQIEDDDRTEWEVAANGVRLSRAERDRLESILRAADVSGGGRASPLDRDPG